jgi:hypothetical protein
MSSLIGSTKQAANWPKGVPAPVKVGEFGKKRLGRLSIRRPAQVALAKDGAGVVAQIDWIELLRQAGPLGHSNLSLTPNVDVTLVGFQHTPVSLHL